MTTSLAATALLVTGMLVGFELCVAALVNPMLNRLPGDAGLRGRAEAARALGRFMPWWYAASVVLCVLLTVLGRGSILTWPTAAAAALLVVSILMSVTLLVPINNRAKTWTPGHEPHDWREQLQRWDRLHHVRVAVIAAGFVFLAVGAAAPTTG